MNLSSMADRKQLERMEAEWILDAYLQIEKTKGRQVAAEYIKAQTKKLEAIYGHGFDGRCRKNMREAFDEQQGNLGNGAK